MDSIEGENMSGPRDEDLNTNEDDDSFEEDNWDAGFYSEDSEEDD
jgi:hypothetical protein